MTVGDGRESKESKYGGVADGDDGCDDDGDADYGEGGADGCWGGAAASDVTGGHYRPGTSPALPRRSPRRNRPSYLICWTSWMGHYGHSLTPTGAAGGVSSVSMKQKEQEN